MRVYSTVPIPVTEIGQRLNEVAKYIARNPRIESITGSDFIVYLTYSYDSSDVLGWIFSSNYGVYQGTRNDASNETMNNFMSRSFRGTTWYETEKEALEAQEKYGAERIAYATEIVSEPADANLKGKAESPANPHNTKTGFLEWIGRYL